MDENGIKSLANLKDELGLLKLHFLSYARLVRVLSNMEKVYPGLKLNSKGVVTPVDKLGKTPLDYISNVVDAFKRIKKRVQLLPEDIGAKKAYGTNNIQNEDGKETEYNP